MGTMNGKRRPLLAAVAALALALGLAACAPEPDASPGVSEAPDGVAGQSEKGGASDDSETSWGGAQNPEIEKQTTLPESFPVEFAVPADAMIDDAAERGEGVWALVLRAEDDAAAADLWNAVITGSGFAISDEQENIDSTSATLNSTALSVQALRIPQPDGTVLLSYDIARVSV